MVMQCINGQIRLGFAAKQAVPAREFLNYCDWPNGTQWNFSTPVTDMDILANYPVIPVLLQRPCAHASSLSWHPPHFPPLP